MAPKKPKGTTSAKKAAPDLFNQPKPKASKAKSSPKPKAQAKAVTAKSSNLPAVRQNTLPAVRQNTLPAAKPAASDIEIIWDSTKPAAKPAAGPAKKAGSNLANDAGRALGRLKNISRGKGLLGLASAAVIGSGLYQTSKIKSKSSPAKASTASSASNFNKGKDPIQQYGVKNPSASTVVKKPSAPATGSTTQKPAAPSTKTGGGSKSSPSKIRKPDSFSRKNIAKGLSAKSVGVKSSSPIGKSPEGAVKNVSLSRPSSTASKSSASPLSKRATMKGLRTEKRSERKLTRMARRENRIVNKTAKLKAKR